VPITFTYQPPAVNAALLVAGMVVAAETAGAEALLAAAKPDVPVESGDLRDSGHVEHDGHGAMVVFSAVNEADGFNYAAKQELDDSLAHPNGGKSHFLGDQMKQARGAIFVAMAAEVKL